MSRFSKPLLAWHAKHGRKDLPWQARRDPYGIWLSEIMLQQTQVTTVIPYYERFLARFPDIPVLARARQDTVLHHWTGLGYYARARNLHKAAKIILKEYGSHFPRHIEQVQALPGIGRSTAGAILAFAWGQRHPILDGNVKRVLSRYHAIAGWPGDKAVEQALWQRAEQHTPDRQVRQYTQAIMDLGATLCTRSKPACEACPVRQHCRVREQGTVADYPAPKPRKTAPVRQTTFIMVRDSHNRLLLVRRPPAGIWGGLWSFPECSPDEDPARYCRQQLGLDIRPGEPQPGLRHSFSHFQLEITPMPAQLLRTPAAAMETGEWLWYNVDQPARLGLAAPVKRLLEALRNTS